MQQVEILLDEYMHEIYGENAQFREGQREAILSVLEGKRTLVVQRTGWGKSLVYFLASKVLRSLGYGPTIVISPLLSLMRNQVKSAEKHGLVAEIITSENHDVHDHIAGLLSEGAIDVLFISPERLGNDKFLSEILPNIHNGIALLAVDEAHCISDWGHDFRPDYRRINRIVRMLPTHTPLLATTATANNRVIEDIRKQLGTDIELHRGNLLRESLKIQTIHMPNKADRLAWIASNVRDMPGSGIIYCSTINDCELVTEYLNMHDIKAASYHARLSSDHKIAAEMRIERENQLLNNELKVLVANIALGMGFDKDDIGFVIHYQLPSSIIAYYQQIGRAGRKLDEASIILLYGEDDLNIQQYFISTAFPPMHILKAVVRHIEQSEEGLSKNDLLEKINISSGILDQCLKLLSIDNMIRKDNAKYYRTLTPLDFQHSRITNVTSQKTHELERMRQFVFTSDCYMRYILNELDSPIQEDCGKCANCSGPFVSDTLTEQEKIEAGIFLQTSYSYIKPRKRWATGGNIKKDRQAEEGLVLCKYGDSGYGELVQKGKYEDLHFDERLVEAMVKMIKEELGDKIDRDVLVTNIPSLRRPYLVKDLAQRVAVSLDIPYQELLKKVEERPEQKEMQNSYMQEQNVRDSLEVIGPEVVNGPQVILIDDMVDSAWTFTVAAALLKEAGYGLIYPAALASSSRSTNVIIKKRFDERR